MPLNIYSFRDYKQFLRESIKNYEPQHGVVSRLAEAAGCQRSYLSQVINGHVHLTADHVFALSKFLRLNEGEREFFLLLLGKERAGSSSYRQHLETKIETLRKENSSIKNKVSARILDANLINDAAMFSYYSSWAKMAIHTIVSIERFQTPEAIGQRLQLPVGFTIDCLNELKHLGFIETKNNRWIYGQSVGNTHISNENSVSALNHNNWRQRSSVNFPLAKDNGNIHYTSVFTLSKLDLHLLRQKILDWISESRDLIGPSSSEEIACLNIDCFIV